MTITTASTMYPYIHPRDELVNVMSRMYDKHLTTSNGGNASVRDSDGIIWITPSQGKKNAGVFERDEITYLESSSKKKWKGGSSNSHPSIEWPIHIEIYKARSDIHAILHAHSPTLIAFSMAGKAPNTMRLAQAAYLCGTEVGVVPYALPGSDDLANCIGTQIKTHDCVLMANHGVVVVAKTMIEAYQKLEALEFCARAGLKANLLGGGNLQGQQLLLTRTDLEAQAKSQIPMEDQTLLDNMMVRVSAGLGGGGGGGGKPSLSTRPPIAPKECELRASLVKFIRRAYDQNLIHCTSGAMSARLSPTSFLITPSGVDRHTMTTNDIILVEFESLAQASMGHGGHFYSEKTGLVPSRAWGIHCTLYQSFPDTQAILHAHPFHITSFCMTSNSSSCISFESNAMPESYVTLGKSVGRISFQQSLDKEGVSKAFRGEESNTVIENGNGDKRPCCDIVLVDNDGVIIKGESMERVFERLEVVETTANILLECKSIGNGINMMTMNQQQEIDKKWTDAREKPEKGTGGEKQDHDSSKHNKKKTPKSPGHSHNGKLVKEEKDK